MRWCRALAVLVPAAGLSVGQVPIRSEPPAGSPGLVRVHARPGWGHPAASATTVYYLSKHHELLALDRRSFALRWRRQLNPTPALPAGVDVAIADDRVIAGDGDVFAFGASDGELRWRLNDAMGAGVLPGLFMGTVTGTSAWFGSGNGIISAVDPVGGQLRWRRQLGSGRFTVFAPVSTGGLVVAAYSDFDATPRNGGIIALDGESGVVQWTFRFPQRTTVAGSAGGSPVVIGAWVIAASSDGTVYGVDRERGTVAWTLAPVESARPAVPLEDFRMLAFVPPILVVTSLSGVMLGIEPGGRAPRWQQWSRQEGSHGFDIATDGARVFVPAGSGRLLVVEGSSGALVASIGSDGQRFDWAPTIVDGQAYLAGEDGLYVACANRCTDQQVGWTGWTPRHTAGE